jgi:hypothetical protein
MMIGVPLMVRILSTKGQAIATRFDFFVTRKLSLGNHGAASLLTTAGAYSFFDTTRSSIVPVYPYPECAPATESGYLITRHDAVLVRFQRSRSVYLDMPSLFTFAGKLATAYSNARCAVD